MSLGQCALGFSLEKVFLIYNYIDINFYNFINAW